MGHTRANGSAASEIRTLSTSLLAQKLTIADYVRPTLRHGREFASDLLNLTLASPDVNRYQKSDKDAARVAFPTKMSVGMRTV